MFKRVLNKEGKVCLQYTDEYPVEKGYWTDIGHITSKNILYIIAVNEALGYEVLQDEHGFYRVQVNKE